MKKLKLSIEKPCSTTRENFYPVGTGYYCTLCQKEVTDFSHYSKSELAENFSNNGSPGCGIFRNDQLNKNILPSPTNEFKLSSLLLSGLLLTTELCLAQSGITDSLKVDSLVTQSVDSIPDDTLVKEVVNTIDSSQYQKVNTKVKPTILKLEEFSIIGDINIQSTAGFVQCYPKQDPLPPFASLSDTINPDDTIVQKINNIETPAALPSFPVPTERSENTPRMDIFTEERKETNLESEEE